MSSPKDRVKNIELAYKKAFPAAYLREKADLNKENPFGYKDGHVDVDGVSFKIRTTEDFLAMRKFTDNVEGWTLKYHANGVWVWDQPPENKGETPFNMLKAFAVFDDVQPWTMYDTLQDSVYRTNWDEGMADGFNLLGLDLNNDLGYYQLKLPALISNRDFCNNRSWRNIDGKEFIIMNGSKAHPRCPPRDGIVRAWSFKSGFVIRPHGEKGCTLTMLAHSDPRGFIPAWLVNSMLTSTAPATLQKLRNAALGYEKWKSADPRRRHRPWVTPPQAWPSQPPDKTPDFIWSRTDGEAYRPPAGAVCPGPPDDWYRADSMLWYAPGGPLYDASNQEVSELTQRVFGAMEAVPDEELPNFGPPPPVPSIDWKAAVQELDDILLEHQPLSGYMAMCCFWTWVALILTGAAAAGYVWGWIGVLVAVPSAFVLGGYSARPCVHSRLYHMTLHAFEVKAGLPLEPTHQPAV
eukprot:Hpha_TRINITY_DN13971_c0_g1::TRINITY_DN13971_c0_g1_i2::g.35693::m.35693